MNYVNYHSHSYNSNVITPDVTISNGQRLQRCMDLEMSVFGGIEHGWCGCFWDIVSLSKKNGLKPLLGVESYFVIDRFQKDKTNAHIILLAKNENGRKAINKILSEANTTGFYYKARIDLPLILSLPASDVWVTTACVGGVWKYDNAEEIVMGLFEHFGNNFFLEVQYHNTEKQVEINKRIIELSNRFGIKIIAGMDSHMIDASQSQERDDYLRSRGVEYPEESGWLLDFPSYDVAVSRFQEQGALTNAQIREAMGNTLTFEAVQDYDSVIFDENIIKLPTIYPNSTQVEKDEIFSNLIWAAWEDEKKNVPSEKRKHYVDEIKKEIKVVVDTKMSDYFILDYEVIRRGKELGGSITMTGRGSAPSFYISKLLGLTTIDRISAEVRLFPERFITTERVLETGSIPDIDLNLGTPAIFAAAQVDILGEGHSYPMIAFGKVRILGAWKLYARISGVDFETSNAISAKLTEFEKDYKHYKEENPDDEDDEFAPNVLDYVGEHADVYLESKKYVGLVNTLTPHPCAFLLFNDGDIREQFGLIKIKTGETEHLCVVCDGNFAEKSKLLKNDLLKVSVVDLIYRIYARVGIEPHGLPELIKLCKNDELVWSIYKNAWGMGINQVEQPGTIGRVAKFAPRNISDLSAFVAAIRPGFKSNYKQFEAREPFSYNVPALDKLIQTIEFPYSYMLYQENAMAVMSFAGIPISQTYEIVKAIAKKRYDKVLKNKEQFVKGMTKRLMELEGLSKPAAEQIAAQTWQIIEDSSRYSFNASHSYSVAGDSLYGAYLKSHYPLYFYETFMRMMEEDGDKDRLASARKEAETAFKIRFPKFKFGQDNRNIVADDTTNSITSSLKTIKGFGSKMGDDMFELSQMPYGEDFLDLLIYAEENGYLSSKFESLIYIQYFSDFGGNKKLLALFNEFKSGKNRYNKKLTQKSKDKRLEELRLFFESLPEENLDFQEQMDKDMDILGYIQSTFDVEKGVAYIFDVKTITNSGYEIRPIIKLYGMKNGVISQIRIDKKLFKSFPFKAKSIVNFKKFQKKFVGHYNENKEWIETEETEYFAISYEIIRP